MCRRAFIVMLAACGGAPSHTGSAQEIALEPHVEQLQWYRVLSTCAQGPYEIALDAANAKYGEDFELQLHTPRNVALDAVVVVDGAVVDRTHGVFDQRGTATGKPANGKCIADAHERIVLGRAGGATTTTGTPATPGTFVPDLPTVAPAPLEVARDVVADGAAIVHVHLDRPAAKILIKFWSVEPNDLAGVLFGAVHVVWRPNVPDAQYEAHLRAEAERTRIVERPVVIDDAEARRVEAERIARERDFAETTRRLEIERALAAERARQHRIWCDAHHDDRDCWGPGGFAIASRLDARIRERDVYCAHHAEDVRCWTYAEWVRRRSAWDRRVADANHHEQPDGPPPAPLADTQPPKPSTHADWRPGYWQWTEHTWLWLAGQWRVPDADLATDTVAAPAPPPPPQAETTPPPPVHVAVWIAGSWMWNGTSWVWIAGSYQLRPEPRVDWRAPEWRARGGMHVYVPGAWVRR